VFIEIHLETLSKDVSVGHVTAACFLGVYFGKYPQECLALSLSAFRNLFRFEQKIPFLSPTFSL
jgi:hypothetical protein